MLAYAAGLLPHEALLMGLWALLLASCTAYVILAIGDRAIDGVERFREGRRMATLLDELNLAGNKEISLQTLTIMWLGEVLEAGNAVQGAKYTIKLRALKFAGYQGLLKIQRRDDGDIGVECKCETKSTAEFFRSRRWLKVKDQEWPPKRQTAQAL